VAIVDVVIFDVVIFDVVHPDARLEWLTGEGLRKGTRSRSRSEDGALIC
jgi:hypothetical protein